MMLILLLCFVPLSVGDVPVTVKIKDGKSVKGTLNLPAIKMKTSFGEVTFEIDKVASVQFGNPDVVTTKDKTKLQGTLQLDALTLKGPDGDIPLKRDVLASVFADRGPAEFEPGQLVDGTVRNDVTYYVRLPAAYDAAGGSPALVVLHGSNMNAKAYVSTIVTAWPKLADEYILIGINGEYRVPNSPDENPAFNYSGVNYVGKSKFKGFPGTDRESPALIPEVLQEIRERLNITKIFIGGHSQGGFVTYSVFMNFPDLVAGAFPISAGPWIQCEPSSYDNEEVRSLQRRVAVAIIHGENDPVVQFSQGKSAYESFDDEAFPALHFFTDPGAGHMFARLPVERAVRWLEQMTANDPASLLQFAEQHVESGEYRDATAALGRARSLDSDGKHHSKIELIEEQIDKAAEPHKAKLMLAIAAAKDDAWVKDFVRFRSQYQFASGARDVMEAYRKLRDAHEEQAQKLFNQARADFQAGKQSDGYAKYEEIVKKFFASSVYRYCKPAIEQRPKAGGK